MHGQPQACAHTQAVACQGISYEAKQGSKHMHICLQAQASPQSQPWTADMAEKGAHLAVRGMTRLLLLRPHSVVHSPIIAH